jgi:hypothetical protein
MSLFFWFTFTIMMLSLIHGLFKSFGLFERIGGGVSATPDSDLDQLVRESW